MPVFNTDTQAPDIKTATHAHAPELAYLVNLAGEGLPYYLWSQTAEPGQSPFEVGRQRACREAGGFSYRNAYVIEQAGRAIATVIGYRQPDAFDPAEWADVPAPVLPLLELEAHAPRSWYLNVLATFKEQRGNGYGTTLMLFSEKLALDAECREISLIVAEHNLARKLYEKLGYRANASRPIVQYEGCEQEGNWILMVKSL
ncbi:MAG: GNAT family N-acetyltransferase [Ketobacter sp.]|nr:MAG: GNAT family N-acetyltransferase [Ketobacter sp.]